MIRRLALFLLLFVVATSAGAQGFSMVSGRNHPELDWQVAETAHFEIMYPAHLQGIEAEAAPIAEASYATLAANLGVTFDKKIRIYLSDEDEVVNGFAVPLGAGHTNIWVHTNAGQEIWTGREKWLRKVLAHELAHIFHFRAVTTKPRWLSVLAGNPLPRFWTEGLAQYETETWDAQRGDRWLRLAVLDDQLSYNDGRSLWNGRLLYASGNAQVRYFAEQYGDTTLARLLAHRDTLLFGLKVHRFEQAMKATIDMSYKDFFDDWRRHINVYYNTLAGQLENTDSLGTDPLPLPGQYVFDVQYSPDTTRLAVLSLTSLERPVQRLWVKDTATDDLRIVAEGSIRAPVAWSPDGERLAFARLSRGENGSLVNDLFVVHADGSGLQRLTHSRRASSPTFAPDGRRLAFIGSAAGTANVFVLDLATRQETPRTRFTGDVQLSGLTWHPTDESLAVARFAADDRRDLVVVDATSGTVQPITDGTHDDRQPVWSPDGTQIAYTSLRDAVPNTFVYDLTTQTHRRVTHLVAGTSAADWLSADSTFPAGSLIVTAATSKERDRAFRISADRAAPDLTPTVPPAYAAWTTHRPPETLPAALAPDPDLITDRYAYQPLRNLTHVVSMALPYYNAPDDWGMAGGTAWIEPLAKHALGVFAGLSFPSLRDKSTFFASYLNNQWHPTINLNLYRIPGSARQYGEDLLVEDYLGGDVYFSWPLDWIDRPYTNETFGLRLRYRDIQPLDLATFDPGEVLPFPTTAQQADLRLGLTFRQQRPYRHNTIHPLDGVGLKLRLTGAAPILGADSEFVRGDVAAYAVLPGLGLQRLYVYGRAQAQTGTPRPQDFLGFSRYDHLQLPINVFGIFFSSTERVRGFREYAVGNRVLFGSVEYRVPLLPSLHTEILGLVSLGATSLALFTDAGMVWTNAKVEDADRRVGVGVELKNALRLGGLFEIGHSVGIAQPAVDVGTDDHYEIYYRIRAAVPF